MAPATTTNVRGITMRQSNVPCKCGADTVGIPAALDGVPLCPACFVAATTDPDANHPGREFAGTGPLTEAQQQQQDAEYVAACQADAEAADREFLRTGRPLDGCPR